MDILPSQRNDIFEPLRLVESFFDGWEGLACPTRRDYNDWIESGLKCGNNGGGKLVAKDNRLELNLNVSGYKPEELKVDVNDGYLTVSGKHEEKSEDGNKFVSRSFSRTHSLPKNVNTGGIKSSLIDGKMLCVEAPLQAIEQSKDNEVPINVNREKDNNKDTEKYA